MLAMKSRHFVAGTWYTLKHPSKRDGQAAQVTYCFDTDQDYLLVEEEYTRHDMRHKCGLFMEGSTIEDVKRDIIYWQPNPTFILSVLENFSALQELIILSPGHLDLQNGIKPSLLRLDEHKVS